MSQKLQIAVLFALLLLFMLAVLKMALAGRAMAYLLPNPIVTKEPIDPYIDQIKAYQNELAQNDLSNETRNLVKERLGMISRMATQRAGGKVLPPTREVTIQATPVIEINSKRLPDGIDNHPSVPFSESVVTVVNSWRKTTANRYYLIYAGYLSRDKQQGAFLVLDPNTYAFRQYTVLDPGGAVKIIKENGVTILLQSAGGNLYYFDAAREQFVDSNGAPVPTSVVSSTPTPGSLYP
jgi:hypothetical protein